MVRSIRDTCSCVTACLSEFETSELRLSQLIRRSECSSPSEAKPRPKEPRRSGVDPMHGREINRCPRSQCRSVGRRCFAWYSRGARDAGGSLFGREHFDTDIDVRVASQPCFPERQAGVVALASRAQETPREHCSSLRLWRGGEKHRKTHC